MKRRNYLLLIFFLALILRTVKLGSFPVGFHVDEVRVGWNAYSILKTGLDDRGNMLALYYNTFGDYRPTGIIYLALPSILLFGLSEFAVRFPAALIGALTVLPLYYFVKEVTKNRELGYLASAYLAISPWHISTSRATSEVVVAVCITLLAMYFFVSGVNKASKKRLDWSLVFFVLSYLFYHSVRIIAPVFVFILIVNYYKKLQKGGLFKRSAAVLLVLVGLTALLSLSKAGTGRFEQVSVFGSDEIASVLAASDTHAFTTLIDSRYVVYMKGLLVEYSKYFTLEFFVGETVLPQRYSTPSVGLMTFPTVMLMLAGIYHSFVNKKYRVILLLFALSAIPAALTVEDSPNLHRSMMMLPFISILVAYGYLFIKRKIIFGKFLVNFILVLLLLNWVHFLISYTTRASQKNGFWRNAGVEEMVLHLNEVRGDYELVYVTNDPDDPYPWFAFYNKLDPNIFNKSAIGRSKGEWQYENLIFTTRECPSGDVFPGKYDEPLDKNVLVVDGFKCPVESKLKDGMKGEVIRQFYNPDGEVYYTLWVASEI